MDYYERKRRASLDLKAWIIDDDRSDFAEFCRVMLNRYGFDISAVKKMLVKNYGLEVTEEGELRKAE